MAIVRGAIGVSVAVVAALVWTVSLGTDRVEATPELGPLGRDELRGVDRYRVTLKAGATLWDLALDRLPLTRLERDEAAAYWLVLESFGRAFPGRSRPLCAYPTHAQYNGSGDPENAANYSCRP